MVKDNIKLLSNSQQFYAFILSLLTYYNASSRNTKKISFDLEVIGIKDGKPKH